MLHSRRFLVAAGLAFACGSVNAHPFHDNIEPVTEAKAAIVADRVVVFLIGSKKLPLSWQDKRLKDVKSRETPRGLVWIVTFQNPAETDSARSTLYIFLDELGNPLNANFTGEM